MKFRKRKIAPCSPDFFFVIFSDLKEHFDKNNSLSQKETAEKKLKNF